MARKPKIQAVVDDALFSHFQQWKNDNNFKTDGDAIRAILMKVISGDIGEISSDKTDLLESRLERIEEALWGDDNVPARAKEAFSECKSLDDAYNDLADSFAESRDRIRELERELKELKAGIPSQSPTNEKLPEDSEEDIPDEISGDIEDIPSKKEEISENIEGTNDKTPHDGTGEELSQEDVPNSESTDISHDISLTKQQLADRWGCVKQTIDNNLKKGAFHWNQYCLKRDPEKVIWDISGDIFIARNFNDSR